MRQQPMILAVVLTAVLAAGCQTTTGRTAGNVIDDSGTTAAVKSKLVAERPANLTSVGVNTVNGIVYLTGVVDTPDQRLRAEQLAWEATTVRQVVNNIQVQRPVAVSTPVTGAASPGTTVRRHSMIGTVVAVDSDRSQATVSTGTEQLLLQLPAAVVRDLRRGDRITLDLGVQRGQ